MLWLHPINRSSSTANTAASKDVPGRAVPLSERSAEVLAAGMGIGGRRSSHSSTSLLRSYVYPSSQLALRTTSALHTVSSIDSCLRTAPSDSSPTSAVHRIPSTPCRINSPIQVRDTGTSPREPLGSSSAVAQGWGPCPPSASPSPSFVGPHAPSGGILCAAECISTAFDGARAALMWAFLLLSLLSAVAFGALAVVGWWKLETTSVRLVLYGLSVKFCHLLNREPAGVQS